MHQQPITAADDTRSEVSDKTEESSRCPSHTSNKRLPDWLTQPTKRARKEEDRTPFDEADLTAIGGSSLGAQQLQRHQAFPPKGKGRGKGGKLQKGGGKPNAKYKPRNPQFEEDDLTPTKMNPKEGDIYKRIINMVDATMPAKLLLVKRELKEAYLEGDLVEYFQIIKSRLLTHMMQTQQWAVVLKPPTEPYMLPCMAGDHVKIVDVVQHTDGDVYFKATSPQSPYMPRLIKAEYAVCIGITPPRAAMAVAADGQPACSGNPGTSAARVIAFDPSADLVACTFPSDDSHQIRTLPLSRVCLRQFLETLEVTSSDTWPVPTDCICPRCGKSDRRPTWPLCKKLSKTAYDVVVDRQGYNQRTILGQLAIPQRLPQQPCADASDQYKVKSEPETGCNIEAKSSMSHAKLLELVKAVQPGVAVTFSIKVTEHGDHDVHLATSMLGSKVEESNAT